MFGREVVDQRRAGRRRGPAGHPRTYSMVTNVQRFPPPVKLGQSEGETEERRSDGLRHANCEDIWASGFDQRSLHTTLLPFIGQKGVLPEALKLHVTVTCTQW